MRKSFKMSLGGVKKTLNVTGWGLDVYSTVNYLKLNVIGKGGSSKIKYYGVGGLGKKHPVHPSLSF